MFASLNTDEKKDFIEQQARLLADKRGSNFFNKAEVRSLAQDAFEMLFNELVELRQNYFVKQSELLKPTNTNEIEFPKDLYKLQLLEQVSGNHTRAVYEKTLDEVSAHSNLFDIYSGWEWGIVPYGYVLFEDKLRLYPEQDLSSADFRLTYVRDPMVDSPLSDKMQKTWEKYIIYKTAYTMTVIEQNPNRELADLAMEWQKKVISIASQRSRGIRTIKELPEHFSY